MSVERVRRSKLNISRVFSWVLRWVIVSWRSRFSWVRIFSRRECWDVRNGCCWLGKVSRR